MAKGKASKLLTAGKHGSTYGGNPLVCSVALTVLETIANENLCQQAEDKGNTINKAFTEQLKNNSALVDIRNKGMMIAIELDQPCTELVALAVEAGLLINVAGGNNIRLLPPLIINDEQIDLLVDTLCKLIEHHTQQ